MLLPCAMELGLYVPPWLLQNNYDSPTHYISDTSVGKVQILQLCSDLPDISPR
jgi:hypothetical protein